MLTPRVLHPIARKSGTYKFLKNGGETSRRFFIFLLKSWIETIIIFFIKG
jgi:hypothetical protein